MTGQFCLVMKFVFLLKESSRSCGKKPYILRGQKSAFWKNKPNEIIGTNTKNTLSKLTPSVPWFWQASIKHWRLIIIWSRWGAQRASSMPSRTSFFVTFWHTSFWGRSYRSEGGVTHEDRTSSCKGRGKYHVTAFVCCLHLPYLFVFVNCLLLS